MTDKKFQPVNLIPWIILFGLLFLLAESRSEEVWQSNDMNNQTTGDVSTNNESRSFAFAHGLGDVDINQCIVTKQTGTFVISWQGYDYNLWCMGEVFDAKGLYKMGALMRCDIPAIRLHFSDDSSCLTANEIRPQEVVTTPTAVFEEHEEREEYHDEQLMEQQQQIIELQAKYDNMRRSPQQKPLLNKKQRAALEEVLAE